VLDTIVRIPAVQATSCTFGGSDGRHLFITSANLNLDPRDAADHPRSGRVFTCQPGVVGLATEAFRPT
jgi:sugar lactone lactonase YvrE